MASSDTSGPPAGGYIGADRVGLIRRDHLGYVISVTEHTFPGHGIAWLKLIVNQGAVGLPGTYPFAVNKHIENAQAGHIKLR